MDSLKIKHVIKAYGKEVLSFCLLSSDFLFRIVKVFKPHWRKLKLISLEQYVSRKRLIKEVLNGESVFNYKMAAPDRSVYEEWQYKEVIRRDCTRQYISLLNNVYVRGDTDAIITEEYFLTDKIIFDRIGFLQHLPERTVVKNDDCIILQKNRDDRHIQKAISLIKMWSYNYFHFVIEGLGRLGEIDKLSEYDNWPIIIDSCVKKDPRNLEIINLLNYKNREIVWIDKGEIIHVDNLVVPPCLSWGVWNISESVRNGWGYMIDKRAGEFLRNTVLNQYKPQKNYNCVYVARGNNKRLLNESEIIDYFEKNGFEIFYPDKIKTFREEVDCFASANCIVSCAGGASTNLIFCKDTVDVYGLLPFEFRCDSPNDITDMIGVNTHMIDGEVVENGELLMTSTFRIPIKKCQRIVDRCRKKGLL